MTDQELMEFLAKPLYTRTDKDKDVLVIWLTGFRARIMIGKSGQVYENWTDAY